MKINHPLVRRRRARTVYGTLLALLGVLALAFFRVQVVRSSTYQLSAESNRLRPLDLPAPRGTVFDRNGRVIADNVPGWAITLLPAPVDSMVATLERLQEVLPHLAASRERLETEARDGRGLQPLVVDGDAAYEQVAALEERRSEFPGVFIETRPIRRYYGGAAVGHLMGYIGEIDGEELASEFYDREPYEQGLTVGKGVGIERQYEHLLQGVKGVRYVEVDARRRIVGDFAGIETRPAVPGQDIHLAIDLELQEWIHRIFPDSMMGAVVALDPADGNVLALYSAPSFDPNLFVGGIPDSTWNALNTDPRRPMYNKAVLGRFAPASPFKLAVAAMGLDLGVVRPDERMPQPCTGGFQYGRYWRCWDAGGHGDIDLLEAVQHSCDVYFYQLGLRIGLQRLLQESTDLGFSSTCGVDLPAESRGIFPQGLEFWEEAYGYAPNESEVLSLSIGQGPNSQTPLKMAQFYTALARDGSAPAPRIYPDGPAPERDPWRLDLSDEALAVLREGLRRVTALGGTAHMASLEHWDLFGKTGTGESNQSQAGLVDTDAWFAGMAGPRGGDPEIVIVVLVQSGGGGSSTAAPIMAKAADFYLRRKHGMEVDTIQTLREHIMTRGYPEWYQTILQDAERAVPVSGSGAGVDSAPDGGR
ncbi:penicillin-binding protein 2 [Gaopeijia maritima]|uniref:Penicillin-binding protein 2 n=1 Tax=Gaopeijia maritima TaxID=3119007 RepID=A0ABU9E8Z6_9BACT